MDNRIDQEHPEIKCNKCKRVIEPPTDEMMFFHMVTEHPMDLLLHKKVASSIGDFFNRLGEAAAGKVKEKFK